MISKDNWVVHEVDFIQFNDLKRKIFTLGKAFNYPKQYFWLFEVNSGFEMIIEQSSVGLHSIPYISFMNKKQTLLCLTDSCVVVDYEKKSILLQRQLDTPCIDIIYINDIAYIVCEADIIKFSAKNNLFIDSLYLSDTVQEISNMNGNWLITLYDGNLVKLPF